MYNVDDESSAFGRLGSMTAVILIFAGFALIIFSIITFNSILLITCCFLPGTGLIIYGFLIFSRLPFFYGPYDLYFPLGKDIYVGAVCVCNYLQINGLFNGSSV